MCSKIWLIIIVVLAALVALLAAIWPQEQLTQIAYIARFFDVMLPILAVGGLVQFLTGVAKRAWSWLIIIISLLAGITASFWPEQRLNELLLVTHFFDVTLPIFAVGALIRYLGLTSRIWAGLIILTALAVAVLSVVLSQEHLITINYIPHFFSIMLPILAAGALIKYLSVGCNKMQSSI